MIKINLMYRGTQMTLWDFGGLGDNGQDGDSSGFYDKVNFDDKVKKKRLGKLCEELTNCEDFVSKIFEELDKKKELKRFFDLKIFGTFESMRTEVESRYNNIETFFLHTNDHKLIHGFWIPALGRNGG